MSRLKQALSLAEQGFYIFPCKEGGKVPAVKNFFNEATREEGKIESWFKNKNHNIGILTSRFGDKEALVVVDIDNKNGKAGYTEIIRLEMEGFELLPSFEQYTPSGGKHILYKAPHACRQGVNVLGEGIDIRSGGGYIVGPSSEIEGKKYTIINNGAGLRTAPDWLINKLGMCKTKKAKSSAPVVAVDSLRALKRAKDYLKTAPVAIEGQSGDAITYKVAANIKDFGCTKDQAIDLMISEWNYRCSPCWSYDDICKKVNHAFLYGQEKPGINAPEAVFATIEDRELANNNLHPIEELNKQYAFIKDGAFILQETTDAKGRFTTLRLSPNDMHYWFANKTITIGQKKTPISKVWINSPKRREYDAVTFSPMNRVPSHFYNLWRGFSVEPAEKSSHRAVDLFLEHALNNVCGGDSEAYKWLIGYFAHLIQRPYEKPLVALVLTGLKGTGKNALIERVGYLLGDHFMVADDERYLIGNFNSHFESNLFFVLDEASWAGDKRAEGKLKGLITGSKHTIERKGSEPYTVDNLTRVAIIGNEKWLVPASQDERRFAVFRVGEGRKQDTKFFNDMRVSMEQGGYACLLRFLLDYDISSIDLNTAPHTQGLLDQKHASLDVVQEWWFECLSSRTLLGSEWEGDIPDRIPLNRFRIAFEKWVSSRNIRNRIPGYYNFLRIIEEITPSLKRMKARSDSPEDATRSFKNPGIEILRKDWCKYIKGNHEWKD